MSKVPQELQYTPEHEYVRRTEEEGVVVVGITYFSLVLGELFPKRLALHAPEAVAAAIARPMQLLSRAMLPFVKLLTFSTEVLLRLVGVVRVRLERVVEPVDARHDRVAGKMARQGRME